LEEDSCTFPDEEEEVELHNLDNPDTHPREDCYNKEDNFELVEGDEGSHDDFAYGVDILGVA
jgi:hypothetical protein